MVLLPKRTKFRKVQKGSLRGIAKGNTEVQFGEVGMKTLGRGWITGRQIEAMRVAINRHLKRQGQVYCRRFPDKPITKRPAETRMGKGKGSPSEWVIPVRPGTILFEIGGNVPVPIMIEALKRADSKLPGTVKTCVVERREEF